MFRSLLILTLAACLLTSCGFRRHKYENPITKDTQQPDKVLFDRAINDIEHGRYEVARITLNTLINTYDQSEYLAKAKLAIADSWFREGGAHGLAEAEAEYKDFILFYPTMEEAAESQEKICMIHYRQMDKADRDPKEAVQAEYECRQLIEQFPKSKFVPQAEQLLRNIQEALADSEFLVGDFYHKKGSNPAAANRLSHLVDQYPLYSKADEALWELGDSYGKMGNRFRQKEGDAFARIVRDYPLSSYVSDAKKKLTELEMPIPQADRAAYDRMKWERDHHHDPSMLARSTLFLRRGPDVSDAAQSGTPTMTNLRPTIPASVPAPAGSTPGFSGDVSATVAGDTTALDTKPDARANPPSAAQLANGQEAAAATNNGAPAAKAQANEPLPLNATYQRKPKKQKKKKKNQKDQTSPAAQINPAATAVPVQK